MVDQVRVGVVGTSPWAEGAHVQQLAYDPRATITSLCGRNRTRAEELAAKYSIPNVFTDYGAMISDVQRHS